MLFKMVCLNSKLSNTWFTKAALHVGVACNPSTCGCCMHKKLITKAEPSLMKQSYLALQEIQLSTRLVTGIVVNTVL